MSNQRDQVIERHDIGPHRLEVERPNIVHIHYDGDVSLEHFKAFDEVIARLSAETFIYLIRDGRNGGFAPPETRAYMARNAHVSRLLAVVTYGATFQGKTFVSMANKAIRALKREGPDLFFVDTEEEARAWIAEHQSQMDALGPPSKT